MAARDLVLVIALVQILQVAAAVAWLIPAVMLLPGIWRVWMRRADPIDALRVPIWLTSLLMIGFSVRWLIWPHALPTMNLTELTAWAALYAGSIIAAVSLALAHVFAERLR